MYIHQSEVNTQCMICISQANLLGRPSKNCLAFWSEDHIPQGCFQLYTFFWNPWLLSTGLVDCTCG